ncbi:Uma2 family endonuclease [Candidatus Viridilinea mediisalina]|uniref:Putative restriction endonuclease domain-containing protein n=1 Tax=Candidatus Viridilinea mediisalina TaxID=2024553 RepID=A0A2A6RIB0_9CHLR|nr:Uma2 family endonuclease [Candidatus Viridilinea mediisalina]PDW02580.1 hypothetical protein CJ255_13330 [Candidatus Viridilinea mediisalina]
MMELTLTPVLMSAEAFQALPERARQCALVRGELVETMPPGGKHGVIALRLGARLERWAETGNYGVVGTESGFILQRDPDTVRSPDLFFVCAAALPPTGVPEAFWAQAPDLVVEIVSPSETAEEVRAKIHDYMAAGTQLIWVVYPRTREVLVHRPGGAIQAYAEEQRLEDAALLPGFGCRVAELFERMA